MVDAGSDNPIYGPFFGVMGAASAIIFSALGEKSNILADTATEGRFT